MTTLRGWAALGVVGLMAWALPADAQQQPGIEADSTRAHLRMTLRAFYFNLAHQDWAAVSAAVLPAKVVAHRPAPATLVAAAQRPARHARPIASAPGEPSGCPPDATALVEQAAITLDGDWAEVSVPGCSGAPAEADEFRFVCFEGRWWIVYIASARRLAG
jgi:hypothetical protein